MFSSGTHYMQVFAAHLVTLSIDSGAVCEIRRDPRCDSPRMLIGDFTMAQHEFKEAVKSVRRGLRAPALLVHPMERIEGGVTQIEDRMFVELGKSAGASRVGVHTGAVLSGDAVRSALRGYRHGVPE